MKHIKLWLATMAVLLCCVTMSAATYSDWTSTNKGQDSSTSSNTYNITASAGDVLTFDWLVSSESGYDKLIVTLSGSEILNKSGEQSGTYQHTFTSSGSYTMVVKYTKDGSVNNGSDYAKVYNIVLSTENSGDSGSENIIASGTCGDNLTWKLSDEGDLFIEGEGDISNPESWDDYKNDIKSIFISEGVTDIEMFTFESHGSLNTISIPSTLCSVGAFAFYNTNFKEVHINSLESWCNINFERDIDVLAANPVYGADLYLNDELVTDLIIPNSVTSIKDEAFSGCKSIASVTLPECLTSIGWCAFFDCSSLTSITCKATTPPASDSNAFLYVDKSIPVYVPISSVEAHKKASCWNEFTNILGIRVILDSGVCGDNLTWTLFDGGELIIEGTGAMNNYPNALSPWNNRRTSITKVIVQNNVTSIGNSAFYECSSLTSITIPESVTSIGNHAFFYCTNLTSITIPEGVTSIGDYAFFYCSSLTAINIPEGVTSIGEDAFSDCSSLTAITIPEGVTSIGDYAFSWCSSLTAITCEAVNPPTIDSYSFNRVNKSIPVYVPAGSVEAYKAVAYWNEFANIQAMPETITINQYGSGTYCSEYALDFSEVAGLKAYAATGYNTRTGVVTLTRVMTAKAGEGLFIKGEPGDYMVPVMEDTDDNTLNMLVGTLTSTDLNGTSDDGNYTNYKYTIKVGDAEPMFYQFDDGSTLSAERAYLQIPTKWLPQAESKVIKLRFVNGEATEIEDIETDKGQQSTAIYDLMGRCVKNPSKGCVYIVNGKKIVY